MSNTINQPGHDLPEPILPDQGGDDAIGRPDGGPGIGNDLSMKPGGFIPAGERDPT